MDTYKIGNFLQALRKAKGLTQQDLADTFEVSNKSVSKWECGQALPELPLLKALADFYDVTVDEILNGEKTTKVFEPKKSKKTNLKYFYNKTVKKFNIMSVSALLVTLLAYILLIALTYTLNVNDIPTVVSYCILFVSVCIFILGFVIYGRLDDDFEKEYIVSFKIYKQKMLIGFIGALLFVFIISTLCYVLPRDVYPVNNLILSLESFFSTSFILLLCIGIPLFVILLFAWNENLRKKVMENNVVFYVLSGLSLLTMIIIPYGVIDNVDPYVGTATIYLNLSMFSFDSDNIVAFIFLIVIPILITIGSIVLAALKQKDKNIRWICYLMCFISSIMYFLYNMIFSSYVTEMAYWPSLVRIVILFVALGLSIFFFFKRKNDLHKAKSKSEDGELIEEKVEINKISQNKKKSVDKSQE